MSQIGTLPEELCARILAAPQRIAFPEAFDPMVLAAANQIATLGAGFPVLVGKRAELEALCVSEGYDVSRFEFIDIDDEELTDQLVEEFSVDTTAKVRGEALKEAMKSPLWYAMVLQALGRVRLATAGYVAPTADVLRAALRIIRPGEKGLCSSVGLVQFPDRAGQPDEMIFLADISVCPNPTAEQLAFIAVDSCDTARSILGKEPTCALLSYSTKGSAEGPEIEKVREAVRIARELRPDLLIDGEFQLDAAVDPLIGAKKAGADNPVAGKADILVFPNLSASNIAVKVMEHYGNGKLYGAILQGFRQTCTDSSRGASLDELVGTILVSAMTAVE